MKGVSQTPKRRGKKLSFFIPDFKKKSPEIREDDPNVLTDKRGERSVCTCVSEFALPPTSSKIIDLFNLTALGYILSPSRVFILLVFCRAAVILSGHNEMRGDMCRSLMCFYVPN